MSKLVLTGEVSVSRNPSRAAVGLVLAAAGALLASCSVGPNYHRPAAPPNDTYYHPEKETAPDTGPAAAIPTPGGAAAAAIPPTSLAPEASAPLPKQALNVGADLDLASALTLESVLATLAAGTADRAEGMRAVLEKRQPAFRGM